MIDYKLEHIFSYTGTLAPPEMIGPAPEGIRVNFYRNRAANLRAPGFTGRYGRLEGIG